jgi:hypothetical protein
MREDFPSREVQDLHPIPGDGRVPHGWLRSINRACTVWLLERGLIEPAEDRVDTCGVPSEEDEEEAARAPMGAEAPGAVTPCPPMAPALAADVIDPDNEAAGDLAEAARREEAR